MLGPARIRTAAEDDAEALANLRSLTLRDAYAGAMPREFVDSMSEQEHASRLRTAIRGGTWTWLIAVAGHELVGACSLGVARDSDMSASSGEIMMIAIVPPYRRHGHGLSLLNAAR